MHLNPESCSSFPPDAQIVLAAFTIEVVLKILAEGYKPWYFFISHDWKWNIFDFLIVFFSMPFISFGSRSLYLLRLVRLARLAKLLNKVPQLRMILFGLIEGLKSIVYILVVLFLVFYIYAVAGIYAFGFNDPFHFRDLKSAMLTLFQVGL
jgi:voltage-gated sodium channel